MCFRHGVPRVPALGNVTNGSLDDEARARHYKADCRVERHRYSFSVVEQRRTVKVPQGKGEADKPDNDGESPGDVREGPPTRREGKEEKSHGREYEGGGSGE